jgi:DNA-directed RNA polymerase specialized sigma24 family protein
MATDQELSDFLASVERRAFKQAVFAVRDDEAALDIVQDAMIKLAEKYGDKSAAELPPLFQRILQNTIHDWFRRQKVRNTWVTLFRTCATSAMATIATCSTHWRPKPAPRWQKAAPTRSNARRSCISSSRKSSVCLRVNARLS